MYVETGEEVRADLGADAVEGLECFLVLFCKKREEEELLGGGGCTRTRRASWKFTPRMKTWIESVWYSSDGAINAAIPLRQTRCGPKNKAGCRVRSKF